RGPVLRVEGEGHQRSERVLLVGGRRLTRERLLVARARGRDVAAILQQAREREDRRRVAALERDRSLVGADGVFRTPIGLVDAGERDGRSVLLGAALRRARLEVLLERREVAVLVAIKLR